MRTLWLLLLLLQCSFLFSLSTISVDADSAMPVCDAKHPESAGMCATPPHVTVQVNPVYPEKARKSRTEGIVVLGLVVQKNGKTRDIHPVSSPSELLSEAAINAVKHWKFDPPTYQGSRVDAQLTVQVNFNLEPKAPGPQSPSSDVNSRNETRNLDTDADEAYRREDYQTAVNICRRVIDLNPQDAYAWNLLGLSLRALNESDAAADAFSHSIRYYPGSPTAYNNLAIVHWRQHKYDEAAVEFRKQMVINPDDHYAHSNLGMMLREEKKCGEAIPELQRGLAITPNKRDALIALGECDIDLGNRAKGISELQQATSSSSVPGIWNSAAYVLAERNIELDLAETWSEASLTMVSTRLQSISLDHLTPAQLNLVTSIAHYWDTRGWIYFLRGDNPNAESYLAAAWRLAPSTAVGDHLAQVYEKTGRRDDAVRTYGMALAAGDLNTRLKPKDADVSDARQHLKLLEPNIDAAVERGRTELARIGVISVTNSANAVGQGDFTLRATSDKKIEAKRISGDASLDPFTQSLQTASLPIPIPQGVKIEIPLRGTLTCKSEAESCRFAVFSSDAAVDLARTEAGTSVQVAEKTSKDPHIYDDPSMGMRISLPDEWTITKEEPGSFSRPYNVTFNKAGTAAFFMLTREHAEATQELYAKILEAGMKAQSQYQRTGEESVKRDGLSGTRWTGTGTNNNIDFIFVTEFFTVGDDHYRLTALAPKEVYDRYAETFANILQSVTFPMLHADPRLLEGLNK